MPSTGPKPTITGRELLGYSPALGSKLGLTAKPPRRVVEHYTGPHFSGRLEALRLRRGMHLYALDIHVEQDLAVEVEMERPSSLFTLVLSGDCRQQRTRPNRGQAVMDFGAGRNVACRFGADRSSFFLAAGKPHRMVDLHLDFDQLHDLIEPAGPISPKLVEALTGDRENGSSPLPYSLRSIARQVLECPLRGRARELFMESKALEILALEMDLLHPSEPIRSPASADRQGLEAAREILDREYQDPPSLHRLARRCGLNEFKLKRGFRQVYDTTVYGYVRRLRMEKARTLLQGGDLNVSQVATAMGYSCLGHFSAAFKGHFGMLPSALRRRQSPPE